jgi:hypothetical protein
MIANSGQPCKLKQSRPRVAILATACATARRTQCYHVDYRDIVQPGLRFRLRASRAHRATIKRPAHIDRPNRRQSISSISGAFSTHGDESMHA